MSALRRAGVWLGLVEDDTEQVTEGAFDEDFGGSLGLAPVRRPSNHPAVVGEREPNRRDERIGYPADRQSVERHLGERPAEPPPARVERASVRQLARPQMAPPAGPSHERPVYPAHDNLALAPQIQLRERAVVGDDASRRYQITTLHPTTYNEARAVGEHFRGGSPVIMNLTGMDEADAKRLVDFAAGLAFGLRGSMERVTNRVFLLSPSNIQVSQEDKARIAEGGFFDQG